MSHFFNRQNAWTRSLQVLNVVALTLAAYDLYQNPDKLSRVGLDMAVHTANFLCLAENTSAIRTFLTTGLNFVQIGALYASATSSCPEMQVPAVLLAADITLHTLSGMTAMSTCNDPSAPSPKAS